MRLNGSLLFGGGADPPGWGPTPGEPMERQASNDDAPVRVRLFAALRERAGWAERSLPLEPHGPPETPAGLWRQLALGDDPPEQAAAIPATIRVAINHAFAAPDTPLHPGDEVAFLPPITGG